MRALYDGRAPAAGTSRSARHVRSRRIVLSLFAGLALVGATGLPLLLDAAFDRRYFRFVMVHLVLGMALLPIYYYVVIRHLAEILGRYRTTVLMVFLILITFGGGIGPPAVSPWHNPLFWRIGVVELAIYAWLRPGRRILAWRLPPLRLFQPSDPAHRSLTVWSGVAALVASWLMMHTGFALILADFKFANDKYWLHGPATFALAPLVPFHWATRGRRFGRRMSGATKGGLGMLVLASAALLAISLEKNLKPLEELRGDERMRVATLGPSAVVPPPIAPEVAAVLEGTAPCRACHDEAAARWEISSHRFAGLNRLYLALLPEVERDLGAAGVRYCDNCHDPVVALTVPPERRLAPETLARSEGVSCKVCHYLDAEEHPAGNGAFGLVMIRGLGFPGAVPNATSVSGFQRYQASLDSRLHIRSVRRPLYREPAACRPCHDIRIPAAYNGAAELELTPLFSSYERWAHRAEVRCRECHMTNVDRDRTEYRQWDHRFPGSNQALSLMVPAQYREQARRLDEINDRFLRGDMPNAHDTEDVRRETPRAARVLWDGTHLPTTLALEPYEVPGADGSPAARLRARVTTTNDAIGHDFPVDLADQVDVWLELRVVAADGALVYESGALDADHRLAPDARRLATEFVDRDGTVLDQHQIWRFAGSRNRRFLAPGSSHDEVFEVPLAGSERRPLRVSARWRFRRVNQHIADWVFADGTTFPVTDLARAEATLD
ncbi:MAG: multiheme c-type cytochrome [bacterium]